MFMCILCVWVCSHWLDATHNNTVITVKPPALSHYIFTTQTSHNRIAQSAIIIISHHIHKNNIKLISSSFYIPLVIVHLFLLSFFWLSPLRDVYLKHFFFHSNFFLSVVSCDINKLYAREFSNGFRILLYCLSLFLLRTNMLCTIRQKCYNLGFHAAYGWVSFTKDKRGDNFLVVINNEFQDECVV